MVERLVPFLRGGKTRDDLTGLNPSFAESLANLVEAAPPEIRHSLGIVSAYRSPERQAQLFSQAVAKYGSEAAARKWVAPPGRSKHNHGDAVDLSFGAKGTPAYDAAVKYAHENAAKYGLAFPMAHENWHVEPVGARAKMLPAAAGGPAQGPAAPGGSPVPSMATMPTTPTADTAPQQPAGPDLGSILASAFTSMTQSPPQKQAQPAAQSIPLPQMPARRPDLAKILAGVSAPLLIGRQDG
jgi:hypothetical protein